MSEKKSKATARKEAIEEAIIQLKKLYDALTAENAKFTNPTKLELAYQKELLKKRKDVKKRLNGFLAALRRGNLSKNMPANVGSRAIATTMPGAQGGAGTKGKRIKSQKVSF